MDHTNQQYSPLPQEGDIVLTAHPNDDHSENFPAIPIKPEVYYGDGPFDPPSSDEEEEELLLKRTRGSAGGRAARDVEGVGGMRLGGRNTPSSLRCLVICLVSLVVTAGLIGVFAALSYTGTSYQIRGTQHITMEHIFNGTFAAEKHGVRWVPEAGDGVFATTRDNNIVLVDLKSNTTKNLVSFMDLKDDKGMPVGWAEWQLSSDMKYMLVKANYMKQWRWSSVGNYYIHNLDTHETHPLIPPSSPPATVIAKWSPTGQSIAFVHSNDLYILSNPSPSSSPVRVTSTGNTSVFNGITDWVYEEEVYSGPTALWWSPDSAKIAFLSFDETSVDEFTFPVYNPTEDSYTVVPYPSHVTMKYPKPGYNNPLVSVHIFEIDKYLENIDGHSGNTTEIAHLSTLELDWDGRQAANNSIIAEVAWVGNGTLLLKDVNRAADNGSVVYFDLSGSTPNHGTTVRKLGREGEQGDDGWIDSAQTIFPLPPSLWPRGLPAYLDVVPSPEGYNHIALYSPANTTTPRFLTSGEWEVTGTILAVDAKHKGVFFHAANPSSIERHIYVIPIPTTASAGTETPKPLTNTAVPSYYDASFSPQGGYYLLSYNGPSAPWQNILQPGNSSFKYVLAENSRLNSTIANYEIPYITHGTIQSDGYELNYREIRPPKMDDSGKTKYPVLFHVYGGPFSQQVDLKFDIDWHYFVASSHKYIVVTVDGRGTGFKGRHLRNPVKDNLGYWETQDQINAAKLWAAKEYVDPSRIGIWGWSYGGFMSSKVVEANAGVHSLAMAVAPVTSWRLYDSIYTERYMNLPAVNPDGYVTASISNVTGFHHADYLLAHGSADDNVHFANAAHMLDMFTQHHVRNFRFRMFTDSDHGISRRGANREVYEFMTEFLTEKWGKGGKRRGW